MKKSNGGGISKPRKCVTKYCRGKVSGHHRKCPKCRYKEEKSRDPERVAYRQLKGNANRRGIPFTITLVEFRLFCFETELLTNRGRCSTGYSVDRIDPAKGYVPGNIQMLPIGENVRRQRRLEYDYVSKKAVVREIRPGLDEDCSDLPF